MGHVITNLIAPTARGSSAASSAVTRAAAETVALPTAGDETTALVGEAVALAEVSSADRYCLVCKGANPDVTRHY